MFGLFATPKPNQNQNHWDPLLRPLTPNAENIFFSVRTLDIEQKGLLVSLDLSYAGNCWNFVLAAGFYAT